MSQKPGSSQRPPASRTGNVVSGGSSPMAVMVPLRTVTVVGSLAWPRAMSTTRALTIT